MGAEKRARRKGGKSEKRRTLGSKKRTIPALVSSDDIVCVCARADVCVCARAGVHASIDVERQKRPTREAKETY